MWILMSEVIIFGIMLSLIIGYFGGFGLGVNKEVGFKDKVQREIAIIKEKAEDNDDDHSISSGEIKYKIERVVGYNGKIKSLQYRIKLTDEEGKNLTKEEIDELLKKVYSDDNDGSNEDNDGDNTTDNNTSSSFSDNMLVYYGWPSAINGAGGDIEKAEEEFKKYDIVILGWGLQDVSHGDYDNTKQIVEDLKGTTKFYGYVPMVQGGTMDEEKIVDAITKWKNVGVDGIFIDEAGSDYWNMYMGGNLDDYKLFLRGTYDYIKLLGMGVMYNSWIPEDLFNNLPLTEDDIVMIEDYYYANGEKKTEYEDHVSRYKIELGKLPIKPKVACIATATNNNQELVNQIKDEVGNKMMDDCTYRMIQDDHGTDSNASVLIPNN